MGGFRSLTGSRIAVSNLVLSAFIAPAALAGAPLSILPQQPTAAVAKPTAKPSSVAATPSSGALAPKPKKTTTKRLARTGVELEINPETIRELFLTNSPTVLQGIGAVKQAANNVTIQRGNLLPSLNLTASTGVTPGFALTSVTALMPFLLPSSWANLDMAGDLYKQAGLGFYVTELNAYAAAYSLYLTIVADEQTMAVTQRQLAIAKEIEATMELQNQTGSAGPGDVAAAKAQVATLESNLEKLQELHSQESAQFATSLALDTDNLRFRHGHPAPLADWEAELNRVGIARATEEIYATTFQAWPEYRQLQAYIATYGPGKVNAIFAPITGYSLTPPTQDNGTVSLGHWRGSTQQIGGNIGFSYGAQINAVDVNMQPYLTQLKQLPAAQRNNIRMTLKSIASSALQTQKNKDAEQQTQTAYQEQMRQYNLGQTTYTALQTAASNVFTAAMATVGSQSDLDNQRVNLYRILISGEFAKIPLCDPKPIDPGTGFATLFFPQLSGKVVDATCRVYSRR